MNWTLALLTPPRTRSGGSARTSVARSASLAGSDANEAFRAAYFTRHPLAHRPGPRSRGAAKPRSRGAAEPRSHGAERQPNGSRQTADEPASRRAARVSGLWLGCPEWPRPLGCCPVGCRLFGCSENTTEMSEQELSRFPSPRWGMGNGLFSARGEFFFAC